MTPPRSPSPLAGLRLLVVEDEFMIADHIGTLLEDLHCEVAGFAATVEEALDLIRVERLDGVLLDGNLNGASSAPVADALKARSIPFVVVTGYSRRDLDRDSLNGAPRLTKPFAPSLFEATLAAAFVM